MGSGGGCPSENNLQNAVLLLQTKLQTNVLAAAGQAPNYFEVDSSGDPCPRITSISECSDAASELGLSDITASDDGQSGSRWDPPYCYFEDSSLKYNSGSNTGSCHAHDKC